MLVLVEAVFINSNRHLCSSLKLSKGYKTKVLIWISQVVATIIIKELLLSSNNLSNLRWLHRWFKVARMEQTTKVNWILVPMSKEPIKVLLLLQVNQRLYKQPLLNPNFNLTMLLLCNNNCNNLNNNNIKVKVQVSNK